MPYSGWKNRQTWNVALWLGNDEGLYNLMRESGSYTATRDALREMGRRFRSGYRR